MPEVTAHPEGTPSWIDLSTTDCEAAETFYADLFGWDFESSPTPDGGAYVMASIGGRSVAGMMTLSDEMSGMGVPPMWNSYITVGDADAAAKRVEEAGGSVMEPAFDIEPAGRMAVLADPTGAVFCLWEPKEHIGVELVGEHGTFTWNELMTSDTTTAGAFYRAVFGWEPQVMDMGEMAYTLFAMDGQPVGGAMNPPMEGIPPHWGIYFHVTDTDAVVEKARAGGGQIMAEPMDSPPGRMAAIADPQGAMFSVIESDPDFDPTA